MSGVGLGVDGEAPRRLPEEVFQACPDGRRPQETHWKHHIFQLFWKSWVKSRAAATVWVNVTSDPANKGKFPVNYTHESKRERLMELYLIQPLSCLSRLIRKGRSLLSCLGDVEHWRNHVELRLNLKPPYISDVNINSSRLFFTIVKGTWPISERLYFISWTVG